ncbi:glycolate oxidase subunit GlcE [Acidovorax sp. Be4]|uniref:Glycolate oxidase subunit GlcE n=1 Tax=Acidovorax bellezanensis TaxID=2976702 RepID=A0ABT2PND9_9BURK|nr:glycolate oxidase subunit GlcE [Acidovorax sp. Be4]MCT9811339.1 glycolate oxidase subunit GlcE [Acidovorax sp. Be4]
MDSALRQITERVRAALADQTPLRLRGGGSKDFHAPALAGELLDTRPLLGVVSYEPSELVVTARAGTSLAELQALLAEHGQCLPFDPPHFSTGVADGATVGGAVAAGLSGPARASVGAVRDYVLGVEILNGRAELLRFGGQVMKNVAGYDVSRLMAGSWGTLGLITEMSLKVLPVAPGEATLRFDCTQAQALQWLNTWGGQPLPLNASCWLEDAGRGSLFLRLRGAKAAVESACLRLGGERQDNARAGADWDACRDQQLPWFTDRLARPELALWRLSVPAQAPALVLPEGARGPLVEWHGALRWVQAPRSLGGALQALAAGVGGTARMFCAERDAPAAAAAVDVAVQPALAALQARLQQAFDPAGIFNPGRLQPLA